MAELALFTGLALAGGVSATKLYVLAVTQARTRSWLRYLKDSVPETATHRLARAATRRD